MKTRTIVIAASVASILAALATTLKRPAIRGDIDGNRRGDIVMEDASNGVMLVVSMNGYAVLGQTNLFNGQSIGDFTLAATTDLDGDGRDDLIFNYQGLHYIVFADTNKPATILLGSNISPWHVVAGGDFNGDGHGDLVFQDADQNIFAMALMQGTNILAADYLWGGTDISPWHIIGGGDFDGDGNADLVIQDGDNSTFGIVNMVGLTMTNANYVTVGSLTDLSPFQVSAVSDLNGDGMSDLIMTNPNDGSQFILFMTNSTAIAGDYVGGSTTNQPAGIIVGPR